MQVLSYAQVRLEAGRLEGRSRAGEVDVSFGSRALSLKEQRRRKKPTPSIAPPSRSSPPSRRCRISDVALWRLGALAGAPLQSPITLGNRSMATGICPCNANRPDSKHFCRGKNVHGHEYAVC